MSGLRNYRSGQMLSAWALITRLTLLAPVEPDGYRLTGGGPADPEHAPSVKHTAISRRSVVRFSRCFGGQA